MKTTLNVLLAALLLVAAVPQVRAQQAPAWQQKKITYEQLVSQYRFPVKQNTGNPEQDQAAYATAKKQWIASNQEIYRQYNAGGTPSSPARRAAVQPVFGQKK